MCILRIMQISTFSHCKNVAKHSILGIREMNFSRNLCTQCVYTASKFSVNLILVSDRKIHKNHENQPT